MAPTSTVATTWPGWNCRGSRQASCAACTAAPVDVNRLTASLWSCARCFLLTGHAFGEMKTPTRWPCNRLNKSQPRVSRVFSPCAASAPNGNPRLTHGRRVIETGAADVTASSPSPASRRTWKHSVISESWTCWRGSAVMNRQQCSGCSMSMPVIREQCSVSEVP